MKVFNGSIRFKSEHKTGETNITEQLAEMVQESQVQEGTATIFAGHTTGAVHLNFPDADLEADFHDIINRIVPKSSQYHHNKGDYGRNADAHLKAILIGQSISMPITKGRLSIGQWQAVYFTELDGPRSRLVTVKVIGI